TNTPSSLLPASVYPQGKPEGQPVLPENPNKAGYVEAGKHPSGANKPDDTLSVHRDGDKTGYVEAGKHPRESNIDGGPNKPGDSQSKTGTGLSRPAETRGGVAAAYAAIPALAQAGRPIAVKGPFDGDLTTSAIKIANQPVKVLAESPRQVVAESPAGLIGKADIEVKKRDRVLARCSLVSVGIRLSAAKLNLVRGETTTMTVTVLGAEAWAGPSFVSVVNQSPWVVRMEGGQSQRLSFDPKQSGGKGTGATAFTMDRTLTGLRAGGFAINATVDQPLARAPGCGSSQPVENPF